MRARPAVQKSHILRAVNSLLARAIGLAALGLTASDAAAQVEIRPPHRRRWSFATCPQTGSSPSS